jgi:predicted nucleotidyltransferase
MYDREYNKIKGTQPISENQLKVLELFTRGFDKSYFVREVSRILSVSPRTAQLNLEALENKGVLESKTKGKIKLYELRKNNIVREYLQLVEMFKKINLLEKHDLIREIVNKMELHVKGIGLVFGSYVKGTEKKDSDLDIFIAGSYDKKEIDKLSGMYSIHISVKNYSLELFKEVWKNDILIREILNNHIIFKGTEEFIVTILDNGEKRDSKSSS